MFRNNEILYTKIILPEILEKKKVGLDGRLSSGNLLGLITLVCNSNILINIRICIRQPDNSIKRCYQPLDVITGHTIR